jgi:hypothetical protein
MAEVLVRFTEAIHDNTGTPYRAQASGAADSDGLWEGWIEFTREDGLTLRTPRETEQPNRVALTYWAEGLTGVYLEGALARASDASAGPPVRFSDPAPSIFDTAAPAARVTRADRVPRPVLDPFATYQQGERVLRQQLSALSRDHLLALVEAYALPVDLSKTITDRHLADEIARAVGEHPSTSHS